MSNGVLYQHFHADERYFIERCLDWIEQVENNFSVITTYFLNPREVQILQSLVNKRELQIFSSQDFAATELSKLILAPTFYELDEQDFDISLLEIRYPAKFYHLTHSQVLGTFLGQAGVKRQELGDIFVTDEKVQLFVSHHLLETFQTIEKIAKATVQIREIDFSNLLEVDNTATREVVLLSSLRIDKIISVCFNLSRNIATDMLKFKKVKINYFEVEKKDFSVNKDDLISVRGFGRIKILDILGMTKKGKQRVEVEIIRNHRKM
ncbi:RNA-binding protein [Lactococcus nasutitermitis]|uniref:RNA-binding protein n=1 Tax=Lactococcus nasutitermitis TaxID=1652957 RepID=A0ABV9J9I1_9LACT|nr:RNA-binding protein [Lactococcus nasutitermitis]